MARAPEFGDEIIYERRGGLSPEQWQAGAAMVIFVHANGLTVDLRCEQTDVHGVPYSADPANAPSWHWPNSDDNDLVDHAPTDESNKPGKAKVGFPAPTIGGDAYLEQ